MLSETAIVELFRAHAEVSAAALARYTEPDIVATEDGLDICPWSQELKLYFLLRLWRPTGKAS